MALTTFAPPRLITHLLPRAAAASIITTLTRSSSSARSLVACIQHQPSIINNRKSLSTSASANRRFSDYTGGNGGINDAWGFGGSSGGGSSGGFSSMGRYRRSPPVNTVILFVPQASVYVVERFGRFHRTLEPGLAVLVPFIDRIRYVQSLKEMTVEIPTQSAITQDNVTLQLDGVLYYRIEDPLKASYGVEDPEFAVAQLAQTTMRAEIGQMTLDRTLAERTQLNTNIVNAINSAAFDWGIKCLRYEIRDVYPPENVVAAMHQQVSAERKKRAEILESEGARQAAINVAEGKKQSMILESEAIKMKQINSAQGEAEAILLKANASAASIAAIGEAIQKQGHSGQDAISLNLAERYIESFGQIAKEGTTVVVPSNVADAASMVTQLMSVYEGVKGGKSKKLLSE